VSSLLGDRAVRLASLSFGVLLVAFALWRVAGG